MNFSSPLAHVCIFFGFLFNLPGLVTLGIVLHPVMVLFTLVTLLVEFDASRRRRRVVVGPLPITNEGG